MRLILGGIVLWFLATSFLISLVGSILWLLKKFSPLRQGESIVWARWTAYGLLLPPSFGFAFAIVGLTSAILCPAVSVRNYHLCMHSARHLCGHVTANAVWKSHALSWLIVVWLGLTGATALLVHRRQRLTKHFQPSSKLRQAIAIARLPSSVPVWEAECDAPAGLVGVVSPSIFVSRKLVQNLSTSELVSVLKHEYAHLVHRDHWLRLLLFVVALLFAPVPLALWLQREWRSACEMAADDFAASGGKSAKSLLTVLKAMQRLVSLKSRDEIQHRIERLETKNQSDFSGNWGFAKAIAIGLVSLVSTAILLFVQPLWLTFHCFAEALMLK